MFERTLQDLIKGIRNTNNDQVAFVAKAIQEIKEEIKSRDVTIKTQAIQKLTYVRMAGSQLFTRGISLHFMFLQLNMLGHDMSWASFNVIEVMSQERFALKRVGFLAASQSFNAKTDVIVLCTQLLKREFQAKSAFEIGLAINCLANSETHLL